MQIEHPPQVDLLILGAGWTSGFLFPLLRRKGLVCAATTTSGRDGTIPFKYDPSSDDPSPFRRLPSATTVLITFPLRGKGPSSHLTRLYTETHKDISATTPRFIQFGSTGIWNTPSWNDSSSPYDETNPRAVAEDELLAVSDAVVLNLAGLYGGTRQPRNWVDRVAKTKAELKAKGALHLIHGDDVARAVVAAHENFEKVKGRRWLLSDLHVYDWWDLVLAWAVDTLQAAEDGSIEDQKSQTVMARQAELKDWVVELMHEEGVRALPRDTPLLGRVLDGRDFWKALSLIPMHVLRVPGGR